MSDRSPTSRFGGRSLASVPLLLFAVRSCCGWLHDTLRYPGASCGSCRLRRDPIEPAPRKLGKKPSPAL
jgi:hypothetical protein